MNHVSSTLFKTIKKVTAKFAIGSFEEKNDYISAPSFMQLLAVAFLETQHWREEKSESICEAREKVCFAQGEY